MESSPTIGALAAALSKAQAKIKGAVKDSANPFFKSSYADLESVWDACREPLTSNNLAVIQTVSLDNGISVLVTTLVHSSGEFVAGRLPLNPIKNDPQSLGSAISYARRYSLAAMVGIYQTDDDGEAAQGRADQKPRAQATGAAAQAMNAKRAEMPKVADYRFGEGKHAGKAVRQLTDSELREYRLELVNKITEAGRTIENAPERIREAVLQLDGEITRRGAYQAVAPQVKVVLKPLG
jgi:hypothetical protein